MSLVTIAETELFSEGPALLLLSPSHLGPRLLEVAAHSEWVSSTEYADPQADLIQ